MGHTDVNELNGKVIVKVEDVHKVYSTSSGPLHAVKGVSFDCRRGETLAVLGPSGSGKSSLMRMIAGLEHISRGRISIDGTVINDVPPEQRNVSLAFENYALYPAMTVRKNLEFPLVNFGQFSKQEIDERVRDIAAYFRLAEVLDRRPAELSGGHSQMVSLGRALIKPASVHILDEPLSHLDLQFRNEVVAKLRTLQRERDLSLILITHDQEEALELSDRVIVIDDGQFQQLGTPNEIVSAPANLFVADFVGEPPMNLLRSRSDGESGHGPRHGRWDQARSRCRYWSSRQRSRASCWHPSDGPVRCERGLVGAHLSRRASAYDAGRTGRSHDSHCGI